MNELRLNNNTTPTCQTNLPEIPLSVSDSPLQSLYTKHIQFFIPTTVILFCANDFPSSMYFCNAIDLWSFQHECSPRWRQFISLLRYFDVWKWKKKCLSQRFLSTIITTTTTAIAILIGGIIINVVYLTRSQPWSRWNTIKCIPAFYCFIFPSHFFFFFFSCFD